MAAAVPRDARARRADSRADAERFTACIMSRRRRTGRLGVTSPEDEVVPAVLGALRLVVPLRLRPLGAVTDGLDLRRRHAELDQVVLGLTGAVLPEGDVVLGGPHLVAVALDADRGVPLARLLGHLLQHWPLLGAQQRRVEVEEHLFLAGLAAVEGLGLGRRGR